jgi:hypothetical protein
MKLYIGNKATGIELHQDAKHPAMWRIHKNGRISDMVNLTRAKDAALASAHIGPSEVATWRQSPEALQPPQVR